MKAQGATEYLVLLAVVLIVALVSVALLGFFPGMASDAQITQSKTYWMSAQPIAIVEIGATVNPAAIQFTDPYLRVRNNGAYPVRITRLLGEGDNISQVSGDSGLLNISDYYYMAPGEEKTFGTSARWGGGISYRYIRFCKPGTGGGNSYELDSASSVCYNSTSSPGVSQVDDFGFEYIEYIDGQQITKRQVGKPLIIKCSG